MKRFLLFVLMAASFSLSATAQTQQGYVKTRGKLSADGKTIIAGKRLGNALVTIEKLSPVKSGTNGTFSFALPSGTNRYRLQNAELKGYVLADPDAVKQTHNYSKDLPLIVVMEDKAQREADLEAARKSVRNVMKREIRKKQDELDSLRDAHAITQAKYDSLMRDFWEFRQSSEKLVSEMAERYVSTDYDQLDDFNRQVQAYIESGQLTKADSMIRTKGSLEERFNRVKQYEATNAQREAEILQQQETLEKSRQYSQKEKEDLANDLYRQHLIFLQQPMMQDSALLCLKLRADLDTTNVDAVWDYAGLSYEQKRFPEAEKYTSIFLHAVSNKNDVSKIGAGQDGLGNLYFSIGDYANSERYLKLALENYEKLYTSNPDAYRADIAMAHNNLGVLYYILNDYTNSIKYHSLALENRERLFASSPKTYRSDLAMTQFNIGILYCDLNSYTNSEKYLVLALENYEKLFADNPDAYCADLAMTQASLGILYNNLNDYVNSEKYKKLALENYENLFAINPDAYRADLAGEQNNLGQLYNDLHDYAQSERYYLQALANKEKLYTETPEAYRTTLAITQFNLGLLYYNLHNYTQSEKYYRYALEHFEILYAIYPDAYQAYLANIQNSLGNLYRDLHDYDSSEKYLLLAMEHFERLYTSNPNAYRSQISMTQHNLGALYRDIRDYTNSEKYFLQALETKKVLFDDNPDGNRADIASTLYNLGFLYDVQNNYVRSEMFFKQAMEHYEKLFVSQPEIFGDDLAQTYSSMINLFAETEQVDKYDACLSKALALYQRLYSTDTFAYKNELIEIQNRTIWRMLINGNIDEALSLAKDNFALDKTNEISIYYFAECLNGKAIQYAYVQDYSNAISVIDEAIDIMPKHADLYDSKGRILLMQGKNQEALKMWQKVLELNPKFLDDYPEGTNLSNGLKEKGLIK